jgi:hypothetical protein
VRRVLRGCRFRAPTAVHMATVPLSSLHVLRAHTLTLERSHVTGPDTGWMRTAAGVDDAQPGISARGTPPGGSEGRAAGWRGRKPRSGFATDRAGASGSCPPQGSRFVLGSGRQVSKTRTRAGRVMTKDPGVAGCRGRALSATCGATCGCVIVESGARFAWRVNQRTRSWSLVGGVSGETLALSVLSDQVVNAPVLIGGPCPTVFELVSAVTDATTERPAGPHGPYDRGSRLTSIRYRSKVHSVQLHRRIP